MIPYQLSIHKYICLLIGSFKTKINSLTCNQFLHCHGFPVPAFSPEITGDFIFCIFCIPSMRNGNVSPTGHIKVSSERFSLKDASVLQNKIPFHIHISVSVAAMTAFIVCIRFSASRKTTEFLLSKTSSVTSISVLPNFSPISFPIFVLRS